MPFRSFNITFHFILIGILLLAFRCSTPKQSYQSKENIYQKSNQSLNANFLAYHLNDSVSELIFNIPNENLVYKRPDTTLAFYASCRVKYFLYPENGNKTIADSGSLVFFDRQGTDVFAKNISGSLYMKAKPGNHTCEIAVYDLNKRSKSTYSMRVEKENVYSRQNFLLRKNNGQVLFSYYVNPGDTLLLQSQRNRSMNLVADYFFREFALPLPPFTMGQREVFQYKPDSFYTISKTMNDFKLVVPPQGFIHLITEPESKTGISIFASDPVFPGIKNAEDMIKCTRYIMAKKEFEECANAANKKNAIDEFWLELGGSQERAKTLLKRYYARVTEANKLFTSYLPGWKTDRGMIYIIFGAPNNMYKFNGGETWVYGEETQSYAVRFHFKKVINPFSDNDYVMERNEYYKEAWYRAVDYWRQGHIYIDN